MTAAPAWFAAPPRLAAPLPPARPASLSLPSPSGSAASGDGPPAVPEALVPVPALERRPVEAWLGDAVAWVLRRAGLLEVLDQVTGDGSALHAAAEGWRDAALRIRESSIALREGAEKVDAGWDGVASEAFGRAMGTYVAIVDELCVSAGAIAVLLNRAGIACALAERTVVGIVADAAAWVAAEAVATAVADLVTLGLATVAGAVAESATLAAFVERAAEASAGLATTLAELAAELDSLKRARATLQATGRLARVQELRRALEQLPVVGEAAGYLAAGTDAAVGPTVGLPLTVTGVRAPAAIVGLTVGRAAEDYWSVRGK